MAEEKIIHLSLNEEGLKELYLTEVQRHLEKIEMDTLLMDSKQLCQMLNLSWPTIEKLFLNDPNFPSIRIGKKWAFNRKEVQEYINRWFEEVRNHGGMVNI